MKFECSKEKIAKAISRADRVTGKNLSLPVLGCLVLETKKDGVLVKATNLDVGLEIFVPCKVLEQGSVAILGNVLSPFISSLSKNDNILNFILQESNLYISSKNSETLIKTYPHEDFPSIPKIDKVDGYKISGKDLLKGLQSVWYSAAISNIKPELSSVYLYPRGDEIIFVATDSFRLAEKSLKIGKNEGFEPILIPFRNAIEIAKVFEDEDGDVELIFETDQLVLNGSEVYLISRIVDGNFPDYQQIIPKEESTVVSLLKEDFAQAMRVSNVFSNNFNQITLTVSPADGIFEISTQNKDKGETINRVKANIEGESIKISFNQKYLTDCLTSIHSDQIRMAFSGVGRPLIITGSKDGSFRYLVMPMNK